MIRDTDIVSAEIVDVAYAIHRDLGPGLTEKVYERVVARLLRRRGYHVERQRRCSFEYEGLRFDGAVVVDLLVNGCVVVEVKAVERTLAVHRRQTYTYLRLLDLEVALLLNFGAATMKEGITRIVNGYRPGPSSRLRVNQTGTADPQPVAGGGGKDARDDNR